MKLIYYDNVRDTYKLDLDPEWEPRGISIKLNDSHTNLFEVMYDMKLNLWMDWLTTIGKFTVPKGKEIGYNELIIPTNDTVRNAYLLNSMMKYNNHVILTGPTGTAKTIGIQAEISKFYNNDKIGNIQTVLSGETTAGQIQVMIEAKMTTRRGKKGNFGPEEGKSKMVIFIDDVNMPKKEVYGAQPPIELLRIWLDKGFWYNLETREPLALHAMSFVCTMGPPSLGRNMLTMRFLRHFFVLYTEPFSQLSLQTIFSSIMDWYFINLPTRLPNGIVGLKDKVIESTIEVYQKIKSSKELFPTPKKSHYTYNLRDISKVFQGMTNANAKSFPDDESFIKLWAHECQRVFMDRLISTDDQTFFTDQILKKIVLSSFKKDWNDMVKCEPLLWGSFIPTMYPDGDNTKKPMGDIYCELVNRNNLEKYSKDYMESYNESMSSSLNLVLFMSAIEHIIRIVRI